VSDPPVDAVDGGRADDAPGRPPEAVFFAGIGVFSLVIGVIYYAATTRSATGTEWVGVAALLGSAAFGFYFGYFLNRTLPAVQADVEAMEQAEAAGETDPGKILYLPDLSIWPLGIGVGLSLTLAGVALGFWVMIPGLALFLQSIIGFAHQSRDRT
jgi:Cytochrome c oxidase subunit IV